jgi:hypothetical protein
MLYPAAFMPVLVDIALVGVVIPLDAVQRGSSVDLLSRSSRTIQEDEQQSYRGRRRRTVASSRAEGTPQKRDRRSSPEQANSNSVSQEPGGERALAAQMPGVEVLQHLWQLFALKRKWKTFPFPHACTHARRPSSWHDMHAACLPRHAHGTARPPPAAAARACGIVPSPSQLLNRHDIMSSI